MKDLLEKLINSGVDLAIRFVLCIIILLVGLKLINWIVKRIGKSKMFLKLDESLRRFLLSFIKISMYVVLFITLASVVGIPMTSFVALLASAGVAIGLALQGALSNLAGGIMILMFKPFKIGDYIQVASGEGKVDDITVFYTKLCTPDNKVITIPNGELTNTAVTNFSVKNTRRVDFSFEVSYGSDMEVVERIINDVAASHDLVHRDPAPFVKFAGQRARTLDFVLRVWCNNDDYWTVYHDIQQSIKKSFDENNIEAPLTNVTLTNK